MSLKWLLIIPRHFAADKKLVTTIDPFGERCFLNWKSMPWQCLQLFNRRGTHHSLLIELMINLIWLNGHPEFWVANNFHWFFVGLFDNRHICRALYLWALWCRSISCEMYNVWRLLVIGDSRMAEDEFGSCLRCSGWAKEVNVVKNASKEGSLFAWIIIIKFKTKITQSLGEMRSRFNH